MTVIREVHLPVTRTARYAVLGPVGAPDVWFVLHGYGQLAAPFLGAFEPIATNARLLVAPEALNRFYLDQPHRKVGATWMTREDRLTDIADYVGYLDTVAQSVLGDAHGRRVTVVGFSQGSATACRWVVHGTTAVHRLILWAGEVPPDLDLAAAVSRLRAVELLLVAGRSDGFITPKVLAAIESRLAAHNIAHRSIAFDGGHRLDRETLTRLAGGAD